MPEIVLVASLTAAPGKHAEVAEAYGAMLEPTHAEDGCLLYAFHQGLDDPHRFAMIERWASRENLEAHRASAHIKATRERTQGLIESAEVVLYEALPGGDRSKGSLAGA